MRPYKAIVLVLESREVGSKVGSSHKGFYWSFWFELLRFLQGVTDEAGELGEEGGTPLLVASMRGRLRPEPRMS